MFLKNLFKKKTGLSPSLSDLPELTTKLFHSSEITMLERDFPFALDYQSHYNRFENYEKNYVQFFFLEGKPIVAICWLDTGDNNPLMYEDTNFDVMSESVFIYAIEVAEGYKHQGWGEKALELFCENKTKVFLDAKGGTEKFYSRCNFEKDETTGYWQYPKKGK